MGYPVDRDEQQSFLLPVSTPATTTIDHSPQDSEQNEEQKSMYSCKEVVCDLFFAIAIGSVASLFLCTILVFALRPLRPPAFEVVSLSVDNFNFCNSSHLTANLNVTFSIENPNYVSAVQYVNDVEASVFYKENDILSTIIEPFYASQNHKTWLQAGISVFSAYINGSIAKDLVADWSSGAVNFSVTVDATITMNPATRKERTLVMSASCEDIRVDTQSASGTMMGGSTKCKSRWVLVFQTVFII